MSADTVILREALAGLPAAERPAFVHAVAERLPGAREGRPEIDYVRLNVTARRGSA
ncbi:MAG TPA: hypothetical protein VEP73_03035 [Actinomycetota bacterium]|nr:hypothetical protein [Actinomycetota bacterium]